MAGGIKKGSASEKRADERAAAAAGVVEREGSLETL